MSWKNKVVWSEGMFMRPQHLQQHARYIENFVEERCAVLRNHGWGFKHLTIDQAMLSLGKFSISSARGVFPDGTPFNIPDDDDPPAPMDVNEDVRDIVIYLGLPARRLGMVEFDGSDDPGLLARYRPAEIEIRDVAAAEGNTPAPIQVGKLNLGLLLGTGQRDEHVCLGAARIREVKADKNVSLDDQYIPPMVDTQVSGSLSGFLTEVHGLLHQRGDALAGRVSEAGRGGAAEISGFLFLQVVNRYEPLMAHLAALEGLHPETFYRIALELAGELATFTEKKRRVPELPPYRHDDLQATFEPVMMQLRRSLSAEIEQRAVPIPLEQRRYGIYIAAIQDRTLLDSANFVLAVSASLAADKIQKQFPAVLKVAPVEEIRKLVNSALPGIGIRPLPVAPRQIPYHAGNVYFELDRNSEFWKQLHSSGGFALHVGAKIPSLAMEFWAIKE